MPQAPEIHRLLRKAARLCGVATSYSDFESKSIKTSDAALINLINAVQDDHRIANPPRAEQLQDLIKGKRERALKCGLAPVLVAWDGELPPTWMWLADSQRDITVTLQPDEGGAFSWTQVIAGAVKRAHGHRVRLSQKDRIPDGYYAVEVKQDNRLVASSFLISAPRTAASGERNWGLFAPAYALQTEKKSSIGGFRELREAMRFTKGKGGSFFGTLPLLASYYEGSKKQISPYSPATRLFWNEIYLDCGNLPGVPASEPQPIAANDDGFVDYDRAYQEKKAAIAHAADVFFGAHADGDNDFKVYEAGNACLKDYAMFRAMEVPPGERKKMERFHRYAQYACHVQMQTMKEEAVSGTCAELYIDYPIGLNSDGFDAQHFSHLFMEGFEVGAPPDLFFSKGQRWGFRPFHPRALEHDRFAYFRATIQHYFKYARMLRLDHIMGLFRIYCVPDGAEGGDGAYVYYPFEALTAVLCLEAHRHGGVLIGENLGTVPDAVQDGMIEHGLNRMWILQFQIGKDPEKTFASIEPEMIAGLNTHDMFPFKSFLDHKDMPELERLKLLDKASADKIIAEREKLLKKWRKLDDPLLYSIEKLAQSPARHVMVAVEDLWKETEPQNIPGTIDQYPNWRKRLSVPLERWGERKDVNDALALMERPQEQA